MYGTFEMLTFFLFGIFVWEQRIDSQVFIHIMSTSISGLSLVNPLVKIIKGNHRGKVLPG